MTRWDKITYDGVEYDFDHLDPFVLRVTPRAEGAPTYRVLVIFRHHTFTVDQEDGDPPELIFTNAAGEDPRCLCPTRHAHSKTLRELIEEQANGRAYFGEEKAHRAQNYFMIENLPGVSGPYCVFFNMVESTQANVDTVMFVTSAYVKPNLPGGLDHITFASLVGTVAAGRQPERPRRSRRRNRRKGQGRR